MNFSRSALFHIRTRVCLKYFGHGCIITTTTVLNAKINEVTYKIPNITNIYLIYLIIPNITYIVENKMPNVSNLVKK